MRNTSNMDEMTQYGEGSDYNTLPTGGDWTNGTEPERTLPASWWNAIMGLFSKNLNQSRVNLDNVIAELVNVLSIGGITPNASLTNQLQTLFNRFVFGDNTTGSTAAANANTLTKSGFYRFIPTTTGAPAAQYYIAIHMQLDLTTAVQIAVGTSVTGYKIRKMTASTWGSWLDIWTSDTDGAGSGLDAGLLAGVDISRIVSGSDARKSTQVSDLNSIISSGFYYTTTTGLNTPLVGNSFVVVHTQHSSNNNYALQIAYHLGSVSSAFIRGNNNGVWGAWQKLWNAGNDGAGSELDADTIDGIDSGRIVYGDSIRGSTKITSGSVNSISKSGFYEVTGVVTETPVTSLGWLLTHVNFVDNANYASQTICCLTAPDVVYIRGKNNTVWGPWRKLWHEGNDGAGSGMDTDLFDGMDSNRFLFGVNQRGTQGSIQDANEVYKSGFYTMDPGQGALLNTPANAASRLIHIQWYIADTNAYQMWAATGNLYTRSKVGSVWTAWAMQYDSLNVGTNWAGTLAAALGTNWTTALAAALGTGWTTALAAAVNAGGRSLLGLSALGADWLTALAAAVGAGGRSLLGLASLGANWLTALAGSITSAATANTAMLRDASGRTKIAAGAAADDAVNKGQLDDRFHPDGRPKLLKPVFGQAGEIGTGLSIPNVGITLALAALNSTDVAFIDSYNDVLRVYRWNGATWSQIGTGLSIPNVGITLALAALNSTDVAFIDSDNDVLRVYTFN